MKSNPYQRVPKARAKISVLTIGGMQNFNEIFDKRMR